MAKFIFDSLCKHPVDNIQYHKKCYDIVSSGHCSLHTVPSLVSARGWGGGHGALAPDTRLLCTDQVEPLSHILRAAAQYFFQGSTHPRRFSEVSDLSYFKEAFKKNVV